MNEAQKQILESYHNELAACSQDFWYWAQFVQTVDEENSCNRPYPIQFDYLHDLDRDYEKHQKLVVLKSRRMIVSYHCMLKKLHKAMFAGTQLPGSVDVYHAAAMSTDELQAIYQFGRMYSTYRMLPWWMQDFNPMMNDNKLLMGFQGEGKIQGFACKREGAQGYGFSDILFDEMAWQEFARGTWGGVVPTLGAKGRVQAVSTPNGKGNIFADLWFNKANKWNNVGRLKLHWTRNPEHDRKWYEAVTEGMEERDIQRHFELSFSYYDGDRVWPAFDYATHVPYKGEPNRFAPIKGRPIYIGWDFGFHSPAALFVQKNTRDQWVCLREYIDFNIDFPDFVKAVKEFRHTFYDPRQFPEVHLVDPAGFQRYHTKGIHGAKCDVDVIKSDIGFGRTCQVRPGSTDVGTRENEGMRLKAVRKAWSLRSDGRPGIIIDDSCETFIEGCNGGYIFAKGTDKPDKNEFSHIQDCLQMVITGLQIMAAGKSKDPETAQERWNESHHNQFDRHKSSRLGMKRG